MTWRRPASLLGRVLPPAPQSRGALAAANLALLICFPIAWAAPLARAGVLPLFSERQISILDGVGELASSDPFLAALVALFAIIAPYAKIAALAAIHFRHAPDADRWLPVIELLGKLSMADVFLIAVYIVVVKDVGVGHVSTAWGLYLFTALVLFSMWLTHLTGRRIKEGRRA